MTNHQFEKIFDPIYRFLDSSGDRAEVFKFESWGSNLAFHKYFFSYFSKNFMTKKKIPLRLFFLLKTFSIMFPEVQTCYDWDLCLKTF